jgi:hypothetical protein
MKTLEFEARLTADRTLLLPDKVAAQLAPGQTVRVVLLVDERTEEDREWAQMAAQEFLRGYAESDAIYDDLPGG